MAQLTYKDVLKLLDAEEDLAENPLQEAVLIGQIENAIQHDGVEWVRDHRKQLISRFKHTKSKM